MKVLLFNSPIYNKKVADKEDFLPPLGLGYIATQLKKEGIDVKIIDCVNDNLTVDEILNIINRERPDTVGINIFSINFDLVRKIVENCHTKTNFIIGGKSTKFLCDDIVKFKTDNNISVVIGEGEYITIDIVNNCVKEQPKFSQGNKVVYEISGNSIYLPRNISNLDLDRSFFGDRVIINKYQKVEQAIVTSRECLYNCAFCGGARSLNQDVPVRERNEESIIKELIQIKQRLYNYSLNSSGKFMASAFQFRPYHGTELYNLLNQKISYEHNDDLDQLTGRKQFNFMAGNFSACSNEKINSFVIETNKLVGNLENVKRNSKL